MAAPNHLLARWDGGWLERSNAGPFDVRYEAHVAIGAAVSLVEAQNVTDAQLAAHGKPATQIDLAVEDTADGTPHYPYTGWGIGDRVAVQGETGSTSTTLARRAAAVSVVESDDTGEAVIVPSVVPLASSPGQPLIIDGRTAAFNTAKKMLDGTLRGQSRAAQPRTVTVRQVSPPPPQGSNPCNPVIDGLTLLHTEHAHNGNEIIYTIPDFYMFDRGDGCGPQPVVPKLMRVVAGGMATGNLIGDGTAFPPGTGDFPYYDDTHTFSQDPGWSPGAVVVADFGLPSILASGDEIEAFTNNGTDIFGDHYVGYGMWGGHASTGLSGTIGGGGSAIVTLDMPFGFAGSDWPVTNDPILGGGDEAFNLLVVAGGAGGYGGDDVAFGLVTRARAYPLGGAGGLPGGAAGAGQADGSAVGGGGGAGGGGAASGTATPGGYFTAGDAAADGTPPSGHFNGQAGGAGAGRYGGGGGDAVDQYGAGGGGGSSFVNPAGGLVSAGHTLWPDEEALQPGVFTGRGPNFSYVWIYFFGYPGL